MERVWKQSLRVFVVSVADRERNQRRSPAGCDFGVIARASNIGNILPFFKSFMLLKSLL